MYTQKCDLVASELSCVMYKCPQEEDGGSLGRQRACMLNFINIVLEVRMRMVSSASPLPQVQARTGLDGL